MKLITMLSALAVTASAFAIENPLTQSYTLTGEDSVNETFKLASNDVVLTIGDTATGTTGTFTITATNPFVSGAGNYDGKVVVNAGSTFNVFSTMTTDWKDTSYSPNLDIYGTVHAKYGKNDTNSYSMVISEKTINVKSGGTLQIDCAQKLLYNSVLNIEAGGHAHIGRLVIQSRGRLIVGANDAFTTDGTKPVSVIMNQGCREGTSTLAFSGIDASATTDFKIDNLTLYGDTQSTFVLPSAAGSLFTVAKITLNFGASKGNTATDSFILQDFANGVFKVTDSSNLSISGTDVLEVTVGSTTYKYNLIAKDASGKAIELDQNQNWAIQDGFFNIVSAVPEPAEWAAIFGALALGLAIYRRRK